MKIINCISEIKALRGSLSGSVGLVPTMGALHRGHSALASQSSKENTTSIASIFVNPIQFNSPEDLKNYPSPLEADIDLLLEAGTDYLFMPNKEDMYTIAHKFVVETDHPYMNMLEGKHRPGHLSGVLTVVLKLFNLIKPTRAYFGKKDFQQLELIQMMVKDFFLDTQVIGCETVREPSGMPCSSRNQRLNEKEKALANHASKIIHQINFKTVTTVKKTLSDLGVEVEYLELINSRVFSAIKVNGIRIIDNFELAHENNCAKA